MFPHCLRWTGSYLRNAYERAFGSRFIEQRAICRVDRSKERVAADVIVIRHEDKDDDNGCSNFFQKRCKIGAMAGGITCWHGCARASLDLCVDSLALCCAVAQVALTASGVPRA